jgi:hypothetical protein
MFAQAPIDQNPHDTVLTLWDWQRVVGHPRGLAGAVAYCAVPRATWPFHAEAAWPGNVATGWRQIELRKSVEAYGKSTGVV